MPYTDDQIKKLKNTDDKVLRTIFDGLSPDQSAELKASVKQYNNRWQERVEKTKTHDGKDSVKREKDGAVWYGREQGNLGSVGWFDASGNRAPDNPYDTTPQKVEKSIIRKAVDKVIDSPNAIMPGVTAGYEYIGKPILESLIPEKYVPNTPTLASVGQGIVSAGEGLYQSAAAAQAMGGVIQNPYQIGPYNTPTVPYNAPERVKEMALKGAGQNLEDVNKAIDTQQAAYDANYKRSAMGEMIGATLPAIAVPNAVGKGLPTQMLTGAAVSAITNPILTPERNLQGTDDYAERKLKETETSAYLGALLPTIPPAIQEAVTLGVPAVNKIVKIAMPTIKTLKSPKKGLMGTADIVLPSDLLTTKKPSEIITDFGGSIKEKQIRAGAGDQAAMADLTKLAYNVANEEGKTPVKLSLGDLTGNTKIKQLEMELESEIDSVVKFRNEQNEQLVSRVNEAVGEAPDVPYSQRVQKSLINKEKEIVDRSRALYKELDAAIENKKAQFEGQFKGAEEVDLSKTAEIVQNTIQKNKTSLVYDNLAEKELRKTLSRMNDPDTVKSYSGIKDLVSSLEEKIAILKRNGEYNTARSLQPVVDSLNKNADDYLIKIGKGDGTIMDPNLSTMANEASDFYKNNVVPYRDPALGLSKIKNNPYSDKAIKSVLSSTPEELEQLFRHLDTDGQGALFDLIKQTARNKSIKDGVVNPKLYAKYLTEREPQIKKMLEEYRKIDPKEIAEIETDMLGLPFLIDQIERAGVATNRFRDVSGSKIAGHLLRKGGASVGGAAVGGPFGYVGGALAEYVLEKGYKFGKYKHLFEPNLASFLGKESGNVKGPTPNIPPSTTPNIPPFPPFNKTLGTSLGEFGEEMKGTLRQPVNLASYRGTKLSNMAGLQEKVEQARYQNEPNLANLFTQPSKIKASATDNIFTLSDTGSEVNATPVSKRDTTTAAFRPISLEGDLTNPGTDSYTKQLKRQERNFDRIVADRIRRAEEDLALHGKKYEVSQEDWDKLMADIEDYHNRPMASKEDGLKPLEEYSVEELEKAMEYREHYWAALKEEAEQNVVLTEGYYDNLPDGAVFIDKDGQIGYKIPRRF